jgi:phosphoribosylformylglycinamidine synthase
VTTADGRFTVLKSRPGSVFRNVQMSWTSGDRSTRSPWVRMFWNAKSGWGEYRCAECRLATEAV